MNSNNNDISANTSKEELTVLEQKNEEIERLKNELAVLEEKVQQAAQREDELTELIAANTDAEKNNKALAKKLAEKERALCEKEKDLAIRELNAANEFAEEQAKSISDYSKQLSALKKEILDAKKELAELKVDIDADVAARDQQVFKKAEKLANELTERANNLMADNLAKAELLEQDRKEAAKQKEANSQLLKEIEDIIDRAVEEKYRDLISEKNDAEEEKNRLYEKLEAQRRELDDYYQIRRTQTNGRSIEEILQSEAKLKADTIKLVEKISQLERKLESVKKDSDKLRSIDELEKKCQNYREEIDLLRKELSEKEIEQSEVMRLKSQKESLIMERDTAKLELSALKGSISALEQRVNSLKTLAERPAEYEARILDITGGSFTSKNRNFLDNPGETEWLDNISKNLNNAGIIISKRLLYAFHTSLKTAEWSPITVLAGVSGTGKSLLPKLYARYGGIYFLPLAVQPDWDSSQALFGYFNAIDNKYITTTLLRAMVQFQNEQDNDCLNDSMMIVLLDEMNLAHVELYFSELLSKLEDRRGANGDNVSIEVELGSNFPPYRVELSKNILWVGTMNEDETTKTLSDKVIDRSNMINFPQPKVFARRRTADIGKRAQEMLPKEAWVKWLNEAVDLSEDETIAKYIGCVEKINQFMGAVGRAIGHRVWQAIEHYISNHPLVILKKKTANDSPNEYQAAIQGAFEEAVVFKLMPKLRGIEITEETKRDCFDPIHDQILQCAPNLENDYKAALNGEEFVWRTSEYLEIQPDASAE